MWIKSYSKVYKETRKEDIWRLWADINNYIKWHDDLDYCKLDGKFTVGNYFMLKPKGAPAVKVEITEVVDNKKFVDCTKFFGAKMYDIHELEETPEGLRITSTLKVTGILTYLWVQLVAKNVANSAPKEMEALVNLVRTNHG
jgi:hypothetical protein